MGRGAAAVLPKSQVSQQTGRLLLPLVSPGKFYSWKDPHGTHGGGGGGALGGGGRWGQVHREAKHALPITEAAGLSPLPHGAMGSLPAPCSLAPPPSKWQKGAEIHWPGNTVRRRALPAGCVGCSRTEDNVAKDQTDGCP